MSAAEKVLSLLSAGQWSLDAIAPAYARVLAKKVGANPGQRISELTMICHADVAAEAAYVKPNQLTLDRNSVGTGVADLIEKTLVQEYPTSKINPFDSSMLQKLNEALTAIENADRSFGHIVRTHIEGFVFVSDVNFRTASFPHFQGIVVLGPKAFDLSATQLAISIVHETAHQELFMVNVVDRLINEPFDFNEVHAPFQGTKRPPIGRLHSLWALYRMVQFQKTIGEINSKHSELLFQNCEAFEPGELTAFANKLVQIAKAEAVA